MKNYMCGYLNFYDNELKLFKIESPSKYEALKELMILSCNTEGGKNEEINWQNSEDYPKTYEELEELLYNSDVVVNVQELN